MEGLFEALGKPFEALALRGPGEALDIACEVLAWQPWRGLASALSKTTVGVACQCLADGCRSLGNANRNAGPVALFAVSWAIASLLRRGSSPKLLKP